MIDQLIVDIGEKWSLVCEQNGTLRRKRPQTIQWLLQRALRDHVSYLPKCQETFYPYPLLPRQQLQTAGSLQ